MERDAAQTTRAAGPPTDAPSQAPTSQSPPAQPQPPAHGAPPPSRRKRRLPNIIGIAAVILVMGIVLFYLHFITPYENTDEAVIEGHATFVGPRVAGQVIRLLVRDNQRVKEGELLVEIDPSDYQAKVAQARANLASAQSPSEEAKDQLLSIVTLYESLGGGWQDEIKPEQHL